MQLIGLVGYYAVLTLTAVAIWPFTYGSKGSIKFYFLTIGIAMALGPIVLPPKLGVYYGLLLNSMLLGWTADTFMGKEDRRRRSIIGGSVLALLPIISHWPVASWLNAIIFPTAGHLILSGVLWPILLRIPILRLPFIVKSCKSEEAGQRSEG